MAIIATVADLGSATTKKGKNYEFIILAENKKRLMSFNGSVTNNNIAIGSKVELTTWGDQGNFIETIKVVDSTTQVNLEGLPTPSAKTGDSSFNKPTGRPSNLDRRMYYSALLKTSAEVVGSLVSANKRDSLLFTNEETEMLAENVVNLADKLNDKTAWVWE